MEQVRELYMQDFVYWIMICITIILASSVVTWIIWDTIVICMGDFFSRNLKTYTGAITNKAVTEHMARKLSGSSLKLEDLAKVVKFNGLAGFEELICGHQDGKARITKTKAVV